jgi:hypothetical protein
VRLAGGLAAPDGERHAADDDGDDDRDDGGERHAAAAHMHRAVVPGQRRPRRGQQGHCKCHPDECQGSILAAAAADDRPASLKQFLVREAYHRNAAAIAAALSARVPAGACQRRQTMPETVSLFDAELLLVLGLALATVAAIVFTAPSFSAGIDRLKLIHNLLGIVIVGGAALIGTILLVWGLAAGRKDLIYISFMPLAGAGLAYGAFTRRHQTWYGALGFKDGTERWRSFWAETASLWRSARGNAPSGSRTGGHGAAPIPLHQPPAGQSRSPRGATTFSGSFNVGAGGGRLLAPLLRYAAHRLSTERITVVPNILHLSIAREGERGERLSLSDPVSELTVRRHDGGPLALSARTDLDFLSLTVWPRRADGSYPVAVGLVPHRLRQGLFAGTIEIDTGDAAEPRLTIPVAGEVR